jgi:hypothetical protein
MGLFLNYLNIEVNPFKALLEKALSQREAPFRITLKENEN